MLAVRSAPDVIRYALQGKVVESLQLEISVREMVNPVFPQIGRPDPSAQYY